MQDPFAIPWQLVVQLTHFSLQEPPHDDRQFPVQTPSQVLLHSPEQVDEQSFAHCAEQLEPEQPPPPELLDVFLQYAVHEELHEEPVHPPLLELFDEFLQYAEHEIPHEEPVQLLLPPPVEPPPYSKSSSLSQLRNTEGSAKHARIGSVFFAPLLKNSRLLSSSSFEILSAIFLSNDIINYMNEPLPRQRERGNIAIAKLQNS